MAVPALYTADIADLTDYWISETIWATPRRILVVELTNIAFSDPSRRIDVEAAIFTRKSGGGWQFALPLTAASGSISIPALGSTESGSSAIFSPTIPFVVLDEVRVVFSSPNPEGNMYGATAPIVDSGIPSASIQFTGEINGGLYNLWGFQARHPGGANKPLSVEIIDDPDRDGHYLIDATLATDESAAITSTLADFNSQLPAGVNMIFGVGQSNDPHTPLTGAIDYLPFEGGDSGDPPAVSFTVTLR